MAGKGKSMRFKYWLVAVILAMGVFIISLVSRAEERESHLIDVGLWLARSCVGEAGFASSETGECASILHVYRKRAKLSGKPIYEVARKYSAALKNREDHPNRWVLGLNREMKKPAGWQPRLSWRVHRPWWEIMLELVDDFLSGKVKDPTPTALHYGGRMDKHRLSTRYWRRLGGLPFLNIFYEYSPSRWHKGYLLGYSPPGAVSASRAAAAPEK